MNVIIRCDSSIEIGTGHLYRCLALGIELKERGHAVTFACLDISGNLNAEVIKNGFVLLESPPGADPEEWIPGISQQDICIIDRYLLDTKYESKLRRIARKVIAIDDWGNRRHDADIIIDPSISSGSDLRRKMNPDIAFYSGPDWVLLRKEFSKARVNSKPRDCFKNTVVFFGGTDPKDLMIDYFKAISKLDSELHFHLLISALHPRKDELLKAHKPAHVTIQISPPNVAEFLSRMDLYFGSAGTISWERLCLGIPGSTVSIAENQVDVARNLDQMGLQTYLGPCETVLPREGLRQLIAQATRPDRLKEMSRKAFGLIDGRGCERAAAVMEKICGSG
jgi:UDP-2,4-diacetamido-2,4,6-trideoxy-beta-L-altropyranose hydrolase